MAFARNSQASAVIGYETQLTISLAASEILHSCLDGFFRLSSPRCFPAAAPLTDEKQALIQLEPINMM